MDWSQGGLFFIPSPDLWQKKAESSRGKLQLTEPTVSFPEKPHVAVTKPWNWNLHDTAPLDKWDISDLQNSYEKFKLIKISRKKPIWDVDQTPCWYNLLDHQFESGPWWVLFQESVLQDALFVLSTGNSSLIFPLVLMSSSIFLLYTLNGLFGSPGTLWLPSGCRPSFSLSLRFSHTHTHAHTHAHGSQVICWKCQQDRSCCEAGASLCFVEAGKSGNPDTRFFESAETLTVSLTWVWPCVHCSSFLSGSSLNMSVIEHGLRGSSDEWLQACWWNRLPEEANRWHAQTYHTVNQCCGGYNNHQQLYLLGKPVFLPPSRGLTGKACSWKVTTVLAWKDYHEWELPLEVCKLLKF